MMRFLTFIKKEFYHILRDRRTLLILFGMPIAQILLFGFALTNEVKNAKLAVWDQAADAQSQKIVQALAASQYFELSHQIGSEQELEPVFSSNEAGLIVIIPPSVDEQLAHNHAAKIQLIADASNPNIATTLVNYASAIIQTHSNTQRIAQRPPYQIGVETRMLYNPQQNDAYNFVPGVMAMVLMLVSAMMTSIAIVREKEMGTMEVLLVSPMKPIQIILAKAVPYLVLSLVNVLTILLLSVYVLDVPINGSIPLLIAESIVFIITSLSLGLLISSITESQQTAMLISMMGLMLPTILFSGFLFPIENMPLPLQVISNAIPAKWFYLIVKGVMIKGLSFAGIWKETLILGGMTLFLLTVSLAKFKIRLA
ncbi:MAG: ABC transporter permease [Bacteroidota bacterium]